MEFKYCSTVKHGETTFYVAPSGNKAFVVIGGCIIAISRPHRDDAYTCEGMMKFGLMLVGCRRGQLSLSEYVASELSKRGMHKTHCKSNYNLFVDALDMMNHDTNCSDRDLCGHMEVVVRDPYIAEYLVSVTSSGLILTTVVDLKEDGILRLLEIPKVSNAYSGMIQDVNSEMFSMVQIPLQNPSPSLCSLIEGLFDGIPSIRNPLNETDVPDRINIIVTSKSCAKTPARIIIEKTKNLYKTNMLNSNTYGHRPAFRTKQESLVNKKSTRICEFVQVKLIRPNVDIWRYRKKVEMYVNPSNETIASIWSTFCCISKALDLNTATIIEVSEELYEAKQKLGEAANAIFGRHTPRFLPPHYKSNISIPQKFLLFQYVQLLNNMPNCFEYLCEVCRAGFDNVDILPENVPIDIEFISDLIIETFRGCVFLGAVVEVLARLDTPGCLDETRMSPSTNSCVDASLLLDISLEVLRSPAVFTEREICITKIARILDFIYTGETIVTTAARESKDIGNSELLSTAISINEAYVFKRSEVFGRLCIYSSALMDFRLKEAGLLSIYE